MPESAQPVAREESSGCRQNNLHLACSTAAKLTGAGAGQDAAAYGKESAGSAKQYSDSTYQQAKKALADKLGQGRKTSDALYERTQGNSQELWSALQEQFKASSPADRKALDVEWKRCVAKSSQEAWNLNT